MMGTWAFAIAGLAGVARWRSSRKSLDALEMAASRGFAGALLTNIIIGSLVFLYNAAVTAVFVEPDFRYRQMFDLEAILIAGLGLASIPYCLNVVLEPTLAARVIGRWERAAELTYAYDIWRRRTAIELAVMAIGAAVAGLAAWTLFMLSHTSS
jgi:hypothetical protein